MTITRRQTVWMVGGIFGAVILISIVCFIMVLGVRAYQWRSPAPRFVMSALRLPAAKVGKDAVSYETYMQQLGSVERFLRGPAGREKNLPTVISSDMKKSILDHAIRIAAIEQLAIDQDVIVTPVDMARAFDALIDRAGTSTTPGEIKQVMQDEFGWEEKDFKLFVIRPAMLEELLQKKMERDTGNKDAFAEEIQKRMQAAVSYLKFK